MHSTRRPATVTLELDATNTSDALDLMRRVRMFAEELRGAGLLVEVTGSVVVTVKPRLLGPKPDATADDA